MNVFDDETTGGSRKGVAFVRRMMRKTKVKHKGEYKKPPAEPFRYDAKKPEDWSEHIQNIFKPDGAEVVKYKRPPKRAKTPEEIKYDQVHRWDYWGLKEKDLEYDEDKKRWWIGDTGYAFPPIAWTDPRDDKVYWGLPRYSSRDKGVHYNRMAFKEDDYPDIPFFMFSKTYANKQWREYIRRNEDNGASEYNTSPSEFYYVNDDYETLGTKQLRTTNAVIPATGRNNRNNVFRR